MNMEDCLDRYAELITVHGLNVQRGQLVNIVAEAVHRDFVVRIVKQCYLHGARHVNVDLTDPRFSELRIEHASEDSLDYVSKNVTVQYDELVDQQAANLRLTGLEYPDLFENTDSDKLNKVQRARMLAVKRFRDEGLMKSLVHWCVAAAATPKWGAKIFPDLSEEKANDQLWEAILKICRADKKNCLERWKAHNDALQKRARILTDMKVKALHFTGPGTDLTVGLSDKAVFLGGQSMSSRDVPFEPNLPTEEVFTTPDYRVTNGIAKVTRPFMIYGKMVRDLTIEFTDGVISNFEASEGEDIFRAYTESDEGANRLGEVALVGIDSPIFECGLVFNEILFDENAACHIAVGKAYRFCLDGGEDMSDDDAAAIGCNDSVVHTDMMISDENVSVSAESYNGKTISLIENGEWTSDFR
ncbi:MAG: aminopeptidase [Candidatus Hydrogenedentota bacterium]